MRGLLWRVAAASGIVLLLADASAAQVRQVNIATNATDPGNSGDTEPSIAVNPINPLEVVVVAFSGNWTATQNAPVWKSSDGGITWRRVLQIPQPQAGLAGPNDQKVAFDSAGRLHIAELGSGASNFNFILRQTGAADAALTVGAAYGDDQPHLDIDLSTTGPCAGRLYSPWLNFGIAQRAVHRHQLGEPRRERHQRRRRQQRRFPQPHQPRRDRAERARLPHLQNP